MPNIASALKAEITRIARKEIRTETEVFKNASAKNKSEILALKQREAILEKTVARLSRGTTNPGGRKVDPGPAPKVRFTAKGLMSMRSRLNLSAKEMGALVGVSAQTIYNWEAEKSKPRPQQVEALATLRGVGKRKVAARLRDMVE